VYPADVKRRYGHELTYLAQYFDCCEINSSFYGHIRPSVGRDWCQRVAQVNPAFRFTAKLFQGFTHLPRGKQPSSPFNLSVSENDEKSARDGLDSIANEGRLGAVLVQFPISFKNQDDTRDYLFVLIKKFSQYPLVVEVRHESWNDADILARLAEEGIGFCNIDQPRLGRSMTATQHATSLVGYVRLHGRNFKEWFGDDNRDDRYDYLYKRKELARWVERIGSVNKNTENTFAITNNHPKGQAAVNALELKNMLSGEKVKAPGTLVKLYQEELGEIAEPDKSMLNGQLFG
jgi:uncharacterized protein YecE (DUF72 family)